MNTLLACPSVASNQIFKDLRGQTNDPCKKSWFTAGLERRFGQRPNPPDHYYYHDPGQFHRIRKTWEPERTSSEGGDQCRPTPRPANTPPERTSSNIANLRKGRKSPLQISCDARVFSTGPGLKPRPRLLSY